jgi:hypothetical protein
MTLKIKVLSILLNRHLWISIRQAVLIWSITSITGCTLVYVIETVNPPWTVWEAYALSLVFSSPATLIATAVIYHLPSLTSRAKRIAFSTASILLTCAGIIGLVAVVFKIEYEFVALTLLPFIPSAILWFFLFTSKQQSAAYISISNTTHY